MRHAGRHRRHARARASCSRRESALLVPPGDPQALAAAVRQARRRRSPARERIGAGGLTAYREHASEAILGARWRALDRSSSSSGLARRPRRSRLGFGALSMLRHRSFETGRFDLGNMVQAVWSTAHGHPLRVTNAHTASRSFGSARTSTRCSRCSRRSGGSGRAPTCCSSPRRWRSRSARCRSTGSRASTSARAVRASASRSSYLALPADDVARAERVPSRSRSRCPRCSTRSGTSDEDRLAPFAPFALFAAICREDIPLVLAGLRRLVRARARAPRRSAPRSPRRGRRVDARSQPASSFPHFGRGQSTLLGALQRGARRRWAIRPRALRARVRPRGRPLPARPRPAARRPVPALPDRAGRSAGAPSEPPLGDADADVDPLPLHGRGDPAARSRRPCSAAHGCATGWRVPAACDSRARGGARRATTSLGAIPVWRELPGRRDAAGARGVVSAARPRWPRARCRLIPPQRGRQRDELARRAPLGAAARPQLPVHRGCDVGRGRRDASRLRGPPRAASDGSAGRVAAAQPGVAARLRARRRTGLPARAAALKAERSAAEGTRTARARGAPPARRPPPLRAGTPSTTYQTTR